MGNFNDKPYPKLKGKWYKALGGGIRYFTFMGPLRFDVGFPLDRDHKDPRYRIYVSIGQAF